MMNDTPLDAELSFDPPEDERPAGEWMEGYWQQMAIWAKHITWSLWAYLAVFVYSNIRLLETMDEWIQDTLISMALSLMLWAIPLALFTFFCLSFSRLLENALRTGTSLRMEKAWQRLQQMLWAGLVLTIVMLYANGANWYYTWRLSQLKHPAYQEEVIPLQSEEEGAETMEYEAK
jgi:hypothetical protein